MKLKVLTDIKHYLDKKLNQFDHSGMNTGAYVLESDEIRKLNMEDIIFWWLVLNSSLSGMGEVQAQ